MLGIKSKVSLGLFVFLFSFSYSVHSLQQCASLVSDKEYVHLIFLLDESSSIEKEDFVIQQKGIIKTIYDLREAGLTENIMISVIYFSSTAKIEDDNIRGNSELMNALSKPHGGGNTNITAAMEKAKQLIMDVSPAEDSEGSEGRVKQRLVILTTDGKPTRPDNPGSALAKVQELSSIQNEDVSIVSIGVGSADRAFLNSISQNSPVPIADDYLVLAREVTKLVRTQVSRTTGLPAVTNFSFTNLGNGEVELSCSGTISDNVDSVYKIEVFDELSHKSNVPVAIESSQTGIFRYVFPREGVFSARCVMEIQYGRDRCKSNAKFLHIPISYGGILDSDGDGLADSWEREGIKDAEGNVVLNLPEMGADPECKDIFIEVDWIGNSRPRRKPFERIIEAFANAPVKNPGRECKGINLHIDAGEGMLLYYDVNDNKVEEQNYNPGGEEIPESDNPGWERLYGTAGEGAKEEWISLQRKYFTPSRKGVFRYAVIFPYKGGYPSGNAFSIPSPGFVSMGESWSDNKIASTFMHELGHALGLGHGGASHIGVPDHTNYKPNYLSIMNYSFQFTWLGEEKSDGFNSLYLDYSRWLTSDLNENDLDETQGIKIEAPDTDSTAFDRLENISTKYYCPNNKSKYSNVRYAIDWNCNGQFWDRNVQADINRGEKKKSKIIYSILAGQRRTDWDNLDYSGRGVVGLGDQASSVGIITPLELELRPHEPLIEEPVPDDQQMAYEVNLTGPMVQEVLPGKRYELKYSVHNSGQSDDRYEITVSSSSSMVRATPATTSLLVSPGFSEELGVELEISKGAKPGDKYLVSIEVASINNNIIVDGLDLAVNVKKTVAVPYFNSGGGGGGAASIELLLALMWWLMMYRGFIRRIF